MSNLDPRIPPEEIDRARAAVTAKVSRLRRRRKAALVGSAALVCAVAVAVLVILLPGHGPATRSVQVTSRSNSTSTTVAPTTTTRPTTTRPTTTTTTAPTTTTTTAPKQSLPPLNLETQPVPSDYTCSEGLYFLSPANLASGICVPYAYLVGGTTSDPSKNTACPAGSYMSMGPVECDNETGIVTPVPPGPNTCSDPGGPCPSSTLPLPPEASVLPWSSIRFPTATCPAGDDFGEADGSATCVPYGYVPGGTTAEPNDNTACPAGSGLRVAKLTGTLCVEDAKPSEIVAPVLATSTSTSTAS